MRPLKPSRGRMLTLAIVGLMCGVLAAFWPALDNGFVDFDDGEYLTGNPRVTGGLSLEGVRWAFTTTYAGNWHPLTWISHQIDAQLFGMNPRGHHLVSLLLHAGAAAVLMAALRSLTGNLWPSALTAALFALHPLRVESVAWASERKDVLAGFLFLSSLWAYVGYLRRPSLAKYLAVTAMTLLALMAKPTAVMLPMILLLLDWWPLGRAGRLPAARLILEKVPLLLLSAVSAVATIVAQKGGGAVSSMSDVPWGPRLANALVSFVWYPWKTLWPSGLAVFYPYPLKPHSAWLVALAAGLLIGAFLAAAVLRRRFPFLAAGWGWYAVTILPMLGIVQAGSQAHADRYGYLPLIGLFLAAAWGLAHVAQGRGNVAAAATAASFLVLWLLMALTRAHTRYWRDSRTLFDHAVLVTEDNWMAHLNLGNDLAEAGRTFEALGHLREAVRINPGFAAAHYDLAMALEDAGLVAEAEAEYGRAVAVDPGYASAYTNWGSLLLRRGMFVEAARLLRTASRLDPGDPAPVYNLGLAAEALGDPAGAKAALATALRLKPDHAGARAAMARVTAGIGRGVTR